MVVGFVVLMIALMFVMPLVVIIGSIISGLMERNRMDKLLGRGARTHRTRL